MAVFDDLVDSYLAIWNEQDTLRKRRGVVALWAPDGTLDGMSPAVYPHWSIPDGHVLRLAKDIVARRDTLRFYWEVVPDDGGSPIAHGMDFIVLDEQGGIRSAHRFGEPPVRSALLNELADRYIELWHEPVPARRHTGVQSIWAADAVLDGEAGPAYGRAAIEAAMTRKYEHVVSRGFVFERTGHAAGRVDVAKLTWELVPSDGGAPISVGLDFLELDPTGQIRRCYQFCDPPVV